MSMSEEYSPASSSCSVVPERTTHDVGSMQANLAEASPRLKLAIAKLPASLTDDEQREAVEIIATWPDASVVSDLNRLIEQARDADLPNVYLMGCLRKRRRERPVDQARPAIAGRIDPVLVKTYKDDEVVKAERAQVDAALAGLSDEAFAALRSRALATFESATRSFVERADPKKSLVLRAAMASILAKDSQQPEAATA